MMSKHRAQWDDTKDFFIVLHLLRATQLGKKSDTGFKKDVWADLRTTFNQKFGAMLNTAQFHTRGQTVTAF